MTASSAPAPGTYERGKAVQIINHEGLVEEGSLETFLREGGVLSAGEGHRDRALHLPHLWDTEFRG